MYNAKKYDVSIVQGEYTRDKSSENVVELNFGSEYKIRLSNLTNKRAVAKITIDGENVSGGGIVVSAHNYVEIERFVDKPQKFEFNSSYSVQAVREGKDGADHDGEKGLIRVEWRPEKVRQRPNQAVLKSLTSDYIPRCGTYTADNKTRRISLPESNTGVTTAGSYSTQNFTFVDMDLDYTIAPVITLIKLMGVSSKNRFCVHCGREKYEENNFCGNCGEKF